MNSTRLPVNPKGKMNTIAIAVFGEAHESYVLSITIDEKPESASLVYTRL
jgi:hypothetical protein